MSETDKNKQSVIDLILHSPRFWAAVLSLLQVMAAITQAQLVEETDDIEQEIIQLQEMIEPLVK